MSYSVPFFDPSRCIEKDGVSKGTYLDSLPTELVEKILSENIIDLYYDNTFHLHKISPFKDVLESNKFWTLLNVSLNSESLFDWKVVPPWYLKYDNKDIHIKMINYINLNKSIKLIGCIIKETKNYIRWYDIRDNIDLSIYKFETEINNDDKNKFYRLSLYNNTYYTTITLRNDLYDIEFDFITIRHTKIKFERYNKKEIFNIILHYQLHGHTRMCYD